MVNVLSILVLAHEGRGSFNSTIHFTRNIPMSLLKTIFFGTTPLPIGSGPPHSWSF